MDNFMLAVLSFFVVLIPLVVIHELGHFFAAKSVGITVLEFGIGIPPRAATLFTRGETEYTLNWIPLGGFVRPFGEDFVRQKSDEEMAADLKEIEGRHIENPKSVFEAGPWERIWFMFAGPFANFVAALLLFILVAFVGQPYAVGDVSLVEILPGSPAEAANLQAGDVITHVDGERVQTLSEFDDAVDDQDLVTLTVERGDEQLSVDLEPTSFQVGDVTEKVLIFNILRDSPADDAGLEIDDVVLAVDGEPVTDIEMLQAYTDEREGTPIEFLIQRDDSTLELSIVPESIDGDVRIGISIQGAPLDRNIGAITAARDVRTEVRPASTLLEGIQLGSQSFVNAMRIIIEAPLLIARGDIEGEQARPASPVAISQFGAEFIRESQEQQAPYPILSFTAIISIALAVTNLLPIPGLDGGRILFVIFELLRGKPMAPEREGFVHMIGILFLLSLIVVVVIWDIVDPIDTSF